MTAAVSLDAEIKRKVYKLCKHEGLLRRRELELSRTNSCCLSPLHTSRSAYRSLLDSPKLTRLQLDFDIDLTRYESLPRLSGSISQQTSVSGSASRVQRSALFFKLSKLVGAARHGHRTFSAMLYLVS